MTTQLTIKVDGPFSLAAAASFGFGPTTGRPFPDAQLMRLDFVADDLQHHVGVALTQPAEGVLEAEVSGEATLDSAERQIRRILSIDTGVAGWLAAGQADPVLGAIQAENPGLRPVLFHSPYEAAAWSCCRSGGTGRRRLRCAVVFVRPPASRSSLQVSPSPRSRCRSSCWRSRSSVGSRRPGSRGCMAWPGLRSMVSWTRACCAPCRRLRPWSGSSGSRVSDRFTRCSST